MAHPIFKSSFLCSHSLLIKYIVHEIMKNGIHIDTMIDCEDHKVTSREKKKKIHDAIDALDLYQDIMLNLDDKILDKFEKDVERETYSSNFLITHMYANLFMHNGNIETDFVKKNAIYCPYGVRFNIAYEGNCVWHDVVRGVGITDGEFTTIRRGAQNNLYSKNDIPNHISICIFNSDMYFDRKSFDTPNIDNTDMVEADALKIPIKLDRCLELIRMKPTEILNLLYASAVIGTVVAKFEDEMVFCGKIADEDELNEILDDMFKYGLDKENKYNDTEDPISNGLINNINGFMFTIENRPDMCFNSLRKNITKTDTININGDIISKDELKDMNDEIISMTKKKEGYDKNAQKTAVKDNIVSESKSTIDDVLDVLMNTIFRGGEESDDDENEEDDHNNKRDMASKHFKNLNDIDLIDECSLFPYNVLQNIMGKCAGNFKSIIKEINRFIDDGMRDYDSISMQDIMQVLSEENSYMIFIMRKNKLSNIMQQDVEEITTADSSSSNVSDNLRCYLIGTDFNNKPCMCEVGGSTLFYRLFGSNIIDMKGKREHSCAGIYHVGSTINASIDYHPIIEYGDDNVDLFYHDALRIMAIDFMKYYIASKNKEIKEVNDKFHKTVRVSNIKYVINTLESIDIFHSTKDIDQAIDVIKSINEGCEFLTCIRSGIDDSKTSVSITYDDKTYIIDKGNLIYTYMNDGYQKGIFDDNHKMAFSTYDKDVTFVGDLVGTEWFRDNLIKILKYIKAIKQ